MKGVLQGCCVSKNYASLLLKHERCVTRMLCIIKLRQLINKTGKVCYKNAVYQKLRQLINKTGNVCYKNAVYQKITPAY